MVWELYIGGYQVMKKWLSYREKVLLGRGLKVEEVREVMRMARRLAAVHFRHLNIHQDDAGPFPGGRSRTHGGRPRQSPPPLRPLSKQCRQVPDILVILDRQRLPFHGSA